MGNKKSVLKPKLNHSCYYDDCYYDDCDHVQLGYTGDTTVGFMCNGARVSSINSKNKMVVNISYPNGITERPEIIIGYAIK